MIPAEAVEEAAAVLRRDDLWELSDEEEARLILEAAAPRMQRKAKADALEEVADLIEPFSGIGLANGATRGEVARWIRARAASYRPTT